MFDERRLYHHIDWLLLGAVLLYGAYGTLDIELVAARIRPDPATLAAAALMTTGLLAKTALFPLHIWLPPAHAGAPAAASAVLSALVVKGSWFLVVRLWFDVMPGVITLSAAQLLAGMGAAAIQLIGRYDHPFERHCLCDTPFEDRRELRAMYGK